MDRKVSSKKAGKSPDLGEVDHHAFDFFEGCQLTSRPAWGTGISKFRLARKARRSKSG